jgi:hypothetical protein
MGEQQERCVMESVIKALKDTPIPTILVVGGMAFLLLAIAGQLAGRIVVAPERQRWAALIGGGLLTIGLALHIVPLLQSTVIDPQVKDVPAPEPPKPPAQEPPKPPAKPPETPPALGPADPSRPTLTEDKEPNNDVASAIFITEGATVQGSIETAEDRDVFTLQASSPKLRVILRKRFNAVVDVYDYAENLVHSLGQREDRTITFTFASTPGSIYYIVVKSSWEAIRPLGARYHGDYQLTVRLE